MDALLVLNNQNVKDCKVMVHLEGKDRIRQVFIHLEEGRLKAAFDFLIKEAQVRRYLPGEIPPPSLPVLLILHERYL